MKISDEMVERALAGYSGSEVPVWSPRERMRAALEAAVGEMVLVPMEPTQAMLDRYEHVRSGADWQTNVFRLTKRQFARHRKAYRALLAAANGEGSGNG